MTRAGRVVAAVVPLALFFAFNFGVDFGNDVGFCVGYSVGDQTGKMKPSENPFCRYVKPEENRVRYAVREAYLYLIGDHP